MKAKKIFLAAAVFALMSTSAAFGGTWKKGTGNDQDRWWYDNNDGTYAKDGWHWIDGDGNGTAECYYFDGNGWLYTNTTTPDNYQVNADGAWVENGTVKTKAVAAVPFSWFEEQGLKCNAEVGVTYDYITRCNSAVNVDTNAKLIFSEYRTFDSDDAHPAKEGYEWKTVHVDVEYGDQFAQMYGLSWSALVRDYYGTERTLGSDESDLFTVNMNGIDYTECTADVKSNLEDWKDDGTRKLTMDLTCRVPKGYDGILISFYNNRLYEEGADIVTRLRDALTFRLK